MKILIVATWNPSSPFLSELKINLEKKGIECDVFDTSTCRLVTEVYRGRRIVNRVLRARFHLPGIGEQLRLKAILRGLSKLSGPYHALSLHYPVSRHVFLLEEFKRLSQRLVITIWGSDFLRIDDAQHDFQLPLFKAADVIISANPDILRLLCLYYKDFENKCRLIRWGLGSLDVIARLQKAESPEVSASLIGADRSRINVVVGYNADPGQRHEEMLRALTNLSQEIKNKIRLLIPLTYPENDGYKSRVIRKAAESGLDYIVYRKLMSVEDVARLRISSDIVLNWQIDDSLSASIQEHAFCGASFVIGEWLLYSSMEEIGIRFRKAGTVELMMAKLEKMINGGSVRENDGIQDKVRQFGGWESNIGAWVKAFE